MKTTVEISDDLFERAQKLARKEKTIFRALTEQGLRLVLREKERVPKKLPPLITVRGHGLTDPYKTASWDQLRDEMALPNSGPPTATSPPSPNSNSATPF